MTTARKLLTRALRKGKIITKHETPTAEELNDALEDLNSLLELWSNDDAMIYARVEESFQLFGGVGEYTIGPGANFDTARPLFIAAAFVRDAGTDYELTVISQEAFAAIANKNETGLPASLVYSNEFPIGKITLSRIPETAYTLHILSEKELTSISSLDTELSFPPGWEAALLDNMIVRQVSEYGLSADALTVKNAADGKELIQRTIRRSKPMDWAKAPQNTHNIMTGYWR